MIGAGAWGTALAMNAHLAGRRVNMWTRQANIAAGLSAGNGNLTYLPGINLPPSICARTSQRPPSILALLKLADQHRVELPICKAVGAILSGKQSVQEAIADLLSRPFKDEI